MSAAPLAGVRVVTIALNLPGPVAAARLQELGADVVTVLPPSGDPVATLVPALYEELHRGQSVRTVDMKSQAGAAEMEQILAEADEVDLERGAETVAEGDADLADPAILQNTEQAAEEKQRADEQPRSDGPRLGLLSGHRATPSVRRRAGRMCEWCVKFC